MNHTPPMRRAAPRLTLLVLCAVAGSIAACSDHPKGVSGDPGVDVKNKDLQANQRIKALEAAWDAVKTDPFRLESARQASKDVLWKTSAPQLLRQRALALLLTDTTPEGMADTRKFLRLRMPTEAQWQVVLDTCKAIESHASDPEWQVMTAALARSYARKVPVPPDDQRPERAALLALHPGQDLAAILFDTYVRPEQNGALKIPDDYIEKSRQAAWEVLGRVDPDGSRRTTLAAAESSADPSVRDVNKCARELGVVPITGSELAWLQRLLDTKDERSVAWWQECSRIVATLGPQQRAGLQLRHIEPVRWAAANHSEWLTLGREQLYNELVSRLNGRKIWLKTEGLGGMDEKSKETPKEWQNQLAWGDLLSILVLDEAVHRPGVIAELFKEAAADRADTTTEYGGLLWSAGQGGVAVEKDGLFAIRGYQPRTTERKDDRTFMAPEAMFGDSARALAHYHFHVQTANNREYAGPGLGDLDYAANHGRSCLVFTSVRDGVMDVDYYQRNGATIDLGEIAVTSGVELRK